MSAGGGEPVALHEQYMAQALDLAEKGRGRTAPNPVVGCVIVKDDEVIGRGWHERAGAPHAEVNALKDAEQAQEEVAGATVYVTLEPCSHFGRTPPCTDALIRAKVRRVIIGAKDSNPKVNGIKALQEADIEVVTGVLQAQAERLNQDEPQEQQEQEVD